MTKLPKRPTFHAKPEILRLNIADRQQVVNQRMSARPWTAGAVVGAFNSALNNAATRAALDPADREILADLERAACLAAGMFATASAPPDQEIEVPLPGSGRVAMIGKGADPKLADPIYWRRGMHAALASRHREAIEVLAAIPISTLHALAPHDPGWLWHEAEALQAIALRNADAGELIVRAMKAADPATATSESQRDWILDVVAPELELGFRAIDRDQAKYDLAMIKALRGHHHYYGKGEAKKDILGQLALAPLSMACVAADLGVKTTLDSDYLPRSIIEYRP
jgi:hypothetical protein